MGIYDYVEGSHRIESMLNQDMTEEERRRIPSESTMTYNNAFTMWITSVFVDIRRSTELFANKDRNMVAGIIRTFVSETARILHSGNCSEIGIRGDCVYAVYSTPSKVSIYEVFNRAVYVNTLINLLNKHYIKMRYPSIKVGIGVATSDDLVVKVGAKGTGVKDRVWIGSAVPDASNLSSLGCKGGISPIVMSETSYFNIQEQLKNELEPRDMPRKSSASGYAFYHCNLVNGSFDDWINKDSGL